MKAIKYLSPHNIATVETDVPVPDAGEALVKVHFTGICGTDMAIVSGRHPRAQPPLIPGHEFAGEVVELRPDDGPNAFAVGDRVTAYPLISCGQCWACRNGFEHVCSSLKLIGIDTDGFMGQYATVPIEALYQLPDDLPMEKGALVEPLAVGVHAVSMANLAANDFCVVIGAGPIGLVVALCLQAAGCREVVATDLNEYRLQLAAKLGLATVDVSQCDVTEKILELTDGTGADVVFEAAGSESAAMQMTQIVRPRGQVIVVSVHKAPHPVDLRAINFKEITVIGTRVYTRADYERAIQLAEDLPIEQLISHKVPIDDGVNGFNLMSNPQGVCKVLIDME